ncbi:MAG: hypothetical protein HY291_00145 [Planctomycetes bacterium]|nr:hypothetical protein [Planctomycetota bacterium]
MRMVLSALAYCILASTSVRAETFKVVERHGQSVRGNIGGHPLLVLRGNHRERGEALGYLAGNEILRFMNECMLPIVKAVSKNENPWEKLLANNTKFAFPERFKLELQGMLDGIRLALPHKEDRLLKELNREVALDDLYMINWLYDARRFGCSSFSVWGSMTKDGQTLFARNMDSSDELPMYNASIGVVATVPSEPGLKPFLDIRMMGLAGVSTAINEDGVAIELNEGNGSAPSTKEGWISRLQVIQEALEGARAQSAVDDVTRVLRAKPVRTGGILHVSFPEISAGHLPAVFEWDGDRANENGATLRPPDDPGAKPFLVSTNHFLTRKASTKPDAASSTCTRDAAIRACLADLLKEKQCVDERVARTILDAVSKHEKGEVTHFSVVTWLKERRIYLAFSPKQGVAATKGEWTSFTWDDVFNLK